MIPYRPLFDPTEEELRQRTGAFFEQCNTRRSLRDFSARTIPRDVVEQLIMTASTAPSGANKQPWTFCVVSDPGLKRQIREAAEAAEKRSYSGRMSAEWLEDLHANRLPGPERSGTGY